MGYPTPEMRERMQGVTPGTPPTGPAGASNANGGQQANPTGSRLRETVPPRRNGSTMPEFPLPDTQTVIKGAKTYARDLLERVVSSFLGGFVAGFVITQPLDGGMWYTALSGGVAAAFSLLKGLAARWRDVTTSASFAKGV